MGQRAGFNTSKYAVPANYDLDQFGTDLNNNGIGALNFVIPDQCDDMHGITVSGTVPGLGHHEGSRPATAAACPTTYR